MKAVKYLLSFIIPLAILFLIIWVLQHYVDSDNKKKEERIRLHLRMDTCTIIDHTYNNGHSVKYEYWYKGKRYSDWIQDYDKTIETNDRFLIEFDSTDPSTNKFRKDLEIASPGQ